MLTYPSATTLVVSLFVVYILHCVWILSTLFVPPECNDSEPCLRSSLLSKNRLMIVGFLTDKNVRLYPQQEPIWRENLQFDKPSEWTKPVKVPANVKKNGTVYVAVFVLPSRTGLVNGETIMNEAEKSAARIRLTQFHVPAPETYNLLGSETVGKPGDKSKVPDASVKKVKVNHMKKRIAVNMMATHVNLPKFSLPPEMRHMFLVNSRLEYLPPLQHNFMATRLKDLEEITPEKDSIDITLSYSPTSFGKMRFLLHMETSMISLKSMGFSDKDLDDIKGIFEDTNMILLLITVVVASLHLILDFLALRHDINYWKTRTDLSGVSGRSVLWRAFSQAVVFLYLFDEKTSLLVLVPSGLNTLLEFWKAKKVITIVPQRRWGIPLYSVHLKRSSQGEELTQKLDAEAMKYLMYLLYPLCIVGAAYSLIYEPHKGWYSWTINSLVNGVYAFGFLFMLPQLFINYRLKSVAHIPWRSFMYKAINTFIDDIFAFIITMPTSHRVACFRDDIVFLIYLYQRWLYPVDQSRLEEGTVRDLAEPQQSEQAVISGNQIAENKEENRIGESQSSKPTDAHGKEVKDKKND
ncbi:hypothetical protein FOCC_FOCC003805 [Frankliniella occidentalis]|uniref:Lipid scramblase CLPTM1L n=1 Tax=Frankliniella occidentalis TaxID=133901 RepID=A0A6J1SYM1_FRAOC|nr:lipid scramblase CLPTM1L [Frankliniella occidentalis]KAE8749540.1 hypothetical protein FOCC_FOCC003805 [Frankliniella occidentalis]